MKPNNRIHLPTTASKETSHNGRFEPIGLENIFYRVIIVTHRTRPAATKTIPAEAMFMMAIRRD